MRRPAVTRGETKEYVCLLLFEFNSSRRANKVSGMSVTLISAATGPRGLCRICTGKLMRKFPCSYAGCVSYVCLMCVFVYCLHSIYAHTQYVCVYVCVFKKIVNGIRIAHLFGLWTPTLQASLLFHNFGNELI